MNITSWRVRFARGYSGKIAREPTNSCDSRMSTPTAISFIFITSKDNKHNRFRNYQAEQSLVEKITPRNVAKFSEKSFWTETTEKRNEEEAINKNYR